MKKALAIIMALCTVALSSAQWKRIKGNGNTVTVERSVGDYDHVALAGWFDVELVDGNEGELILKGESNLLEYIKTEVKDGKLTIKQKKGINLKPSSWNKGITIVVPIENVNGVSLSGSGDILGKTKLQSDHFKASISGSGDITLEVEAKSVDAAMSGSGDMNLSGKTIDFKVSVSGSGDIRAYDLEADFVKAQVSGSADIKVTANEILKARISGSGDVSYRGNPKKIDTKISGSGDISSH